MTHHNRPFVPSPELDPQLESAVWSVLSEPIDMSAVERVKIRAESMLVDSHQRVRLPISPPMRRRRILTLTSLAAGILLVIGATLLLPSTSTAFAQVIEQLKSAGAFRFTKLIYTDQQDKPIEVQVMVADNGRERSESSGTISVMNSDGQLRVTLIEATKTAIVAQPREMPHVPSQRQLAWLEQLKSHGTKPDRNLGSKTLGGRSVEGFVAKQGRNEFTIWVDAKTNDLVQIEHDGMVEGSPVSRVVMKDFRFNETFDESLFSFEVPNGYKAMHMPPSPALLSGEESIIEALRGFTKMADGKFPKSLVDWSEWAVFLSQSGTSQEEMTAIMSRLGAITPFLFSMSKDDYQYLGAGKSTTDDRTIVFWHRTDDRQIRAIYNDLTVAVIKETDLPESK
jgi:outer membrane lipoprotein-sorting protein